MDEHKKIEQVSWNLSQSIISELSILLRASSVNFVRGNYSASLSNLQAIRMRISANLKPDETKSFRAKENKLNLLLNQKSFVHPFDQETINEYNKNTLPKIYNLLDEYNEELMSCLKKLGFLIPQKEDKTRMLA